MELLASLTDDQKALLGCAVALFVCGTAMSLSYYLGRWKSSGETTTSEVHPTILRIWQEEDAETAAPASAESPAVAPAERRAA